MIDFFRNSSAHLFVEKLDQEIEIDGEDHHHLSRVMRLKIGDKISVASNFRVSEFEIINIDKNSISAKATGQEETIVEPEISIIVSLFKLDRLEWGIAKAIETGAKRIVIATSERSPIKLDEKKRERFNQRVNAIVKNASMQSRRSSLAQVDITQDFLDACRNAKSPLVICDPNGNKEIPEAPVSLVIGPEGGFSNNEMSSLQEIGTLWSMSPFMLRAETAMALATGFVAGK